MTVDYKGAKDMIVPDSITFNSLAPKVIVMHKAGGAGTIQALYNTWMATSKSSHFGVGLNGEVAQFVRLSRGAGANCCTEAGYNSFWNQYKTAYGNLNLCTISIECCDPTDDNSHRMSDAQVNAMHELVLWLCQKYKIDVGHIHSHASIDPINRARCPGPTFDFKALFSYIISNGGHNTTLQFDKEAVDCWNSTNHLFDGLDNPVPKTGTGIFDSWKLAWLRGHIFGPPLTNEYDTTDAQGNAKVAQNFAGGRAEWDPTLQTAKWFTAQGEVTF